MTVPTWFQPQDYESTEHVISAEKLVEMHSGDRDVLRRAYTDSGLVLCPVRHALDGGVIPMEPYIEKMNNKGDLLITQWHLRKKEPES